MKKKKILELEELKKALDILQSLQDGTVTISKENGEVYYDIYNATLRAIPPLKRVLKKYE